MKLLKEDLIKWNSETFGKLEDRKNNALAKLEELGHNRKIMSIEQQAECEAERISIKKELEEVAKAEEISWG